MRVVMLGVSGPHDVRGLEGRDDLTRTYDDRVWPPAAAGHAQVLARGTVSPGNGR